MANIRDCIVEAACGAVSHTYTSPIGEYRSDVVYVVHLHPHMHALLGQSACHVCAASVCSFIVDSVAVSLWNPRVRWSHSATGGLSRASWRSIGAVPGPHRIRGVLSCGVQSAVCPVRPQRQPSSAALSPRHVSKRCTLPYPVLTYPICPATLLCVSLSS